jgi:chemotaxis protein MotB
MNVWPGWVDALSSLIMVIIFVVMILMVAQFYLAQTLSGRDQELVHLNQKIVELGSLLTAERQTATASLKAAQDRGGILEAQLAEQTEKTRRAQQDIDQRDIRLKDLLNTVEATQTTLTSEQQQTSQSRQQIAALTAELEALNAQLAKLTADLGTSRTQNATQEAHIDELTSRLNVALANKVEELARYRSEFFGRLREAIGTRPDIRVVGDRFVFQSEVLFPTGSATLQEAGKGQLAQLAHTLMDIAKTIPPDVNWILRVDGHTDPRRIATSQFPSNWELSTARAISVVKFLVDQGIPPERLAATGFGEFQPLEAGTTEDAYNRNRRIELKLDQR